jgi:nitrogen fixation NifU-like protein
MYSPLVLDHFQNPRNCGVLADANASALAKNPVCGDVVELSLRVEQQTIAQVRFRAQGCVATIACASRFTEMILGAELNDALNVDRESLCSSLSGLPEESRHAAQLCLDALRSALRGWAGSRR